MKQRKRGIRRMFAGAMAALMVLSAADVSGWGVMDAKAEDTTVGTIPQYLTIGSTKIINNGDFQDDGISDNDDTIYQGTNWYYDSTKNQLVLENASISGHITSMNGDLSIILSGTNTMESEMLIQSISTESGIVPTLEINGNNHNGSLSCGTISVGDDVSNNNNLNIIGATLETSEIDCSGSVTIENSHVVANDDSSTVISGDKIKIVDSYVEAKATTERYEGKVIRSNQQINVSESQIVVSRALACPEPVLSDCSFSNSVITKQWKDADTNETVTKTYVYGKATLKEDLTIASGESIEFESGASITNPEKLTLAEGASLLVDGAEHTHNTDGNVTYTWKDDNNHIKNVACKDCPIGYVMKETESHSIGENGFCACNEVYQPADLTTDKYDINGDKIKDEVYEISNAGQLYWFAGLVNGTLSGETQNASANAVLTADIIVNENVLKSDGTVNEGTFKEWTPIADCMEDHTTQYSGTFDGNNKTVSGLYLNGNSARIGLFGSSEADGNIKNVGVVDSYFKGNVFVGGVCGRNDGTITNCYNAGNLTAIDPNAVIGGICGYNGGTIANCYNTGTVTATGSIASVGGVCGSSITPISNCYNIGTVTATSSGADISGICGYNFGPVTNCYYLADTEDENGGKTAAQFASGEIAYLLSQGCTVGEGEGENAVTYSGSVWGQALGGNGDTYPVLKKAGDVENTVYRNETYQGCEGNKGELVYSYSNTQETPVYAEHTDEDLDGKCDICKLDFKTFKQLGLLIAKVNKNLSDGKYADVQYTTASIDNLRTALVAAGAVTEASSDTDIATAFDKLLAASTVGAGGLIKADHNIVILFADEGAASGIASGNGWYANGETVTLTVTPSVGYSFGKWTKDKAGNTSVGTESAYTFTLGNDSPDAYYAWLDEVKYTVTCESVEGGTGIASEEQYVYGQKATVTATANDNYEFVGWKDSYGTTVSTDAAYNFTVLGDTTLTPEFVKVKTEEGKEIAYVTVSFYHQSGKLLDSQKVVSGEGKITTTVNAPTKVGFDFLGWSAKASGATAEDVVDFKTATFSENTSLYPVFKAQDITYTLKVGSQTEQKAPQSSVTVTADPMEGKQFVGWKDANGNIVSYDSTYTFIITGDTTLTAYYEQVDSEVVKEPTIVIGEPVISVKEQGVSKKATMYFNYDIPSGNESVDIGVVYVSGKQNMLDMNTPGVVIRSAMSTINASPNNVKNQFYYSKTMTADSEYTFMGYIVYTDSSGKRITIYSDLKNASYND